MYIHYSHRILNAATIGFRTGYSILNLKKKKNEKGFMLIHPIIRIETVVFDDTERSRSRWLWRKVVCLESGM